MAKYVRLKDGTFKKVEDSEDKWKKNKDGTFSKVTAPIKEEKKTTTKKTKKKEAEERAKQKALFDYQFSKKDEQGNLLGGLSWDEVREEKKKYASDSAEYKYLSNYTNFATLQDFDKALAYEKAPFQYNGQRLTTEQVKQNGLTVPLANAPRKISATDMILNGKGKIPTPNFDASGILALPTFGQQNVSNQVSYAQPNSEYINELEKAKNIRGLDNQFDYYKHYTEKKDFEEKSAYNPKFKAEKNWLGNAKTLDQLYMFMNVDEKEQDKYLMENFSIDGSMGMPEEINLVRYMRDDEKKVFNYLFNTDREKANEYFEDIKPNLSRRNAQRVQGQVEKMSEEMPVTSSILSVPLNVIGGASGGVQTAIDKVQGKETDYYGSAFGGNLMATTIRNKVGQDIADSTEGVEILGTNVPSFLYQSGMSASDTLLGSTIFGKGYSVIAGSSAYQTKARELYEAGEDRDTIEKVAIASGTVEVLFEYLSIDKLMKETTVIGAKQVLKSALKQAGVEASEEFCTEIANIYIDEFGRGGNSDLSQMRKELKAQGYSESEINKKIHQQMNRQIGEALVGGALSGGFMGGGMSAVNNAKYTDTEKQFVSDIVQERVDAKEKESGKKLTTKERLKIQDDVVNELHNGDFTREELEERFGGDSYTEYQQLLKENDEYKSLLKMKGLERTGEQDNLLNKYNKMNEEMSFSDRLAESRSKLADTVKTATGKSGLLDLAYGERGRRTEKFTVSEEQMKKYSEKEKEIVQKAIDYGEMNNTRKAHEFVDLVAKLSADKGVSFDFTNNERLKNSGFALEGKTINGFKSGNNIVINLESNNRFETVVGHEITHVLEGSKELYKALQDNVIEYAKQKGVYDSMYKEIVHLYRNQFQNETLQKRKELYDSEITADLVGQYIFSDVDFVRNLSMKNRNVFQKVYDEIKYMLKSVTSGSDAERQLLKAKKIFEDVYRDTKNNTSEKTQLSLEDIANNNKKSYNKSPNITEQVIRKYYDTKKTEFFVNDFYNYYQIQMGEELSHKIVRTIPIDGNEEYIKSLERSLENGLNTSRENIAPYNANIENSKGYDNSIDVTTQGQQSWAEYIDEFLERHESNRVDGTNDNTESSRNNSIAPPTKTSSQNGVFFDEKTQFSVSDNKGRTLTKEQQEKFKDSVVRDENGNLLTMYHGTPNGDYTVFRDGTYFTSNKEYADVYQNQGASSLGYKKTANNPKTYEVYLDIKKPFDTRNPKERAIFENEYYGKWGMGTPLMESGLPDWMDGEDLREFLEEKGYDYDGLILDEGGVGGYGDDVKSRGYSYVVFNPNQVKNVDNQKPTDNADIRYSISDNGKMVDNNGKEVTLETSDVGTHGTLMAIRNINEGELRGMLELDGIPVPSIAITNPNIVDHSNFGRISVLFDKETINPANKKNEVYDRDIWSSRFPTVEYEIDTKKASVLSDRGYKVGDIAYFNPVTFYPDNLEDSLRREKGEQGLIESGKNDYGLKNLYLAETSEPVNIVTAERTIETPKGEAEQYSYMLQHMANEIAEVTKMSGKDWFVKHGEKFNEVEKAYWKQEVPTLTEEDLQQIVESRKPIKLVGIAKKIQQYSETGGKVVEQYQDHEATKQEIDNRINKTEYEAWLRDLYKGIEKSKGIRNNVDLFTPSGNRRSFKALHDSYTLENIVKNMTKGKTQGSEKALFGISAGAISSQMATRYKSISDIKKDEGRISANADEQVKPLTDRLQNGIDSLRDYYNGGAYNFYDSSTGAVFEFSQKKLTESNFRRILSEYPFEVDKIPSETLQEIIDSLNALKDIPTDYFEAKPQRAVGLDEIQAIVVPNDIDAQLRKDLIDKGLHIIEYNPNVEGDRQRVVNQFDELKFSLSEKNKPIAPIKNGIYAEDIALEKPIAPIGEKIAQTHENTSQTHENAPIEQEPTDHLGEVNGMVAPIGENVQKREVQGMDTLPLPQEHEVKGVRMNAEEKARKGEVRRWIDTSTESEVVNGEVLPKDLDQSQIYYEPISNKKTLNTANADLDRMGYDKALQVFNAKMESRTLSLSDIALGERLVQESLKRGDKQTTGELIQNIAILGTELGQKVQALSIIQRMTPEGQLKMLRKVVNRGKAKGDNAFKNVEFTQEMEGKILDAYNKDGTYDQDKLNEAVESVKQDIADQMEVTNMDKVNAWRMLSMLGNPKTHIRNIVSNVTMQATNEMKNALARTVETIAPIKNRTKTWKTASEDVKKFAEQSTKEVEEIMMGEHSYSEVQDIKAKRDVFKNKILQNVYDFNSDMLTKEDAFFKRPVYRRSLQEFLTANGIKTQEDIKKNKKLVEKGKQYAMEQSQIATFQQYSWLANKINEIERKNVATQIGVGSVLPFKKTPINIAKTGLAYSPLGFAKSLSYDLVQMKKGNMEASQVIDNLSKGVTGSALTYIGYMLAMSGLLNGGGEDDKEGKYDYQLGEQSYSLNFGGNTYSLSWLTPVAMPLFVGANAYEMVKEGKELTFDSTMDALAQTLDPMSEMSFLSSLDSVLTSYESGAGKFMGIFETAGQNYVTQFAPTLLGQVAQVTDDKKRSTQVSADSDARIIEQTINKMKYKIPFLRQTLEPTIDIWGNEVKQSENLVGRAVETFIAPYSRKESIATEIDEEIKGLYSQTGDDGIIPNVPSNKVKYGGETYRMPAREFTDYKKTYGQTANEMLQELFRTEMYQNADNTTRAELVNKVYDYARDVSNKAYLEKEGVKYTNTTEKGVPVYKDNKIKGAIDNDMMLEEFELFSNNVKKYNFLKKNNISYEEYSSNKKTYDWAYNNPTSVTIAKATTGDIATYKQYQDGLNDLESDKNALGKSIPNSLKNKKFAYINNLNVDYNTKMLLWKQQYPSDDRYNVEIIEYLNNRPDISYQEMVEILEELDFTVSADGTVRWN